MKHYRKYIVGIFFIFFALDNGIYAQDMSDGFKMLEEGRFEKARSFFGNILKEHPDNKTARLCYGRAIGLSGEAEKGTSVFKELLQMYPGDGEVVLNLAESYLWQKKPLPAIPIYQNLIQNDPSLFGAMLGLANSYSMAKAYKEAYATIQKALEIDGGNSQAQLSAKYIRLGYANELASVHHQYDSAIHLIDLNLNHDPADQESLSLLANVYLISKAYEKARNVYSELQNPLASVKGESIALHLLEKNEEALGIVETAFQRSWTEKQQLELSLHHIVALLWNNQLAEAREKIDSLSTLFPNSKEVLATQTDVYMYEADFINAIGHFDAYLSMEPKSFSANLGKANALYALGEDSRAYALGFSAKALFPGQRDIEGFIDKLDEKHSPTVYSQYMFGKASDGSIIRGIANGATASLSPKTMIGMGYEHRTFLPPLGGSSSTSETYSVEVQQQVSKRLKLTAAYGNIGISIQEQDAVVRRSDFDISAEAWVNKSLKLSLGYQTEIQNFNAALINQNLKTQHLVAKSIVFWKPVGIGWYSELYHSFFSDGNTRSLLFTSLYQSITGKPSFKYGANFLVMTFSENRPLDYYSPKIFVKPELFGGAEHTFKNISLTCSMEGAAGYQLVDGDNQPNFRVQSQVSKKLGAFTFLISGLYTTITATQASGFSYLEAKGKITWRFMQKPFFKHNKE